MNNKNDTSLTKMCVSCGQLKPLLAFLQLGDQGETYGNVCSTCRKTSFETPKKEESDESTRSSTGYKIDNKTKLAETIDKRERLKHIDERYREDREKLTIEKEEQELKTQHIEEEKEKHRKTYLEKRSFLATPVAKSPTPSVAQSIEQKNQTTHELNKADVMNKNQSILEEENRKTTEFTNPIPNVAGKYHSEALRSFLTSIGKVNLLRPIEKSLDKVERDKLQSKKIENEQKEQESLTNYVHNTWKKR